MEVEYPHKHSRRPTALIKQFVFYYMLYKMLLEDRLEASLSELMHMYM